MVSSACNAATLWMQFTRHQRCFVAEGVGDGVLGKRGEFGHQCDVIRFGGVLAISDDFLGDFPRILATWYHFSGNFHRYVLGFRLGVPIPGSFLEDAAMASPKRRAGAFFGVGNTS